MRLESTKFLDGDVNKVYASPQVRAMFHELRAHALKPDLEAVIQNHLGRLDDLMIESAADIAPGDFMTGFVGFKIGDLLIRPQRPERMIADRQQLEKELSEEGRGLTTEDEARLRRPYKLVVEVSTACDCCGKSDDPIIKKGSRTRSQKEVKSYLPSFEFYANLPYTLSKLGMLDKKSNKLQCGQCSTEMSVTGFKHYLVPKDPHSQQIVRFIVLREKNTRRMVQKFVRVAYKEIDKDIGDNNGITVVVDYGRGNPAGRFRRNFKNQTPPVSLDDLARGSRNYEVLLKHGVIPTSLRHDETRKALNMRDASVYATLLTYLRAVQSERGFWAPFEVADIIEDDVATPRFRATGKNIEEFRMIQSYLQVDRGAVLTPTDIDNICHRLAAAKGWDVDDVHDRMPHSGNVIIEVRFEDADNYRRGNDPDSAIYHRSYEEIAEQLYASLLKDNPGAKAMNDALLKIFGE